MTINFTKWMQKTLKNYESLTSDEVVLSLHWILGQAWLDAFEEFKSGFNKDVRSSMIVKSPSDLEEQLKWANITIKSLQEQYAELKDENDMLSNKVDFWKARVNAEKRSVIQENNKKTIKRQSETIIELASKLTNEQDKVKKLEKEFEALMGREKN